MKQLFFFWIVSHLFIFNQAQSELCDSNDANRTIVATLGTSINFSVCVVANISNPQFPILKNLHSKRYSESLWKVGFKATDFRILWVGPTFNNYSFRYFTSAYDVSPIRSSSQIKKYKLRGLSKSLLILETLLICVLQKVKKNTEISVTFDTERNVRDQMKSNVLLKQIDSGNILISYAVNVSISTD
ncbi:hypothetical protein Bpfe_001227 [Biomphalaria pfeifferi]|uniref:Uncharacterized protein n=1 Tax=Biomphalaria pfeifferi TaxID=112525 RepID=A0AAD8CBK5_BIOPF|nr:hypothetical protein Bpfe_001227 [Biomphalaria pfeifferi]